MSKQTLLLTGASGQLGKTFQWLWPQSSLSDSYYLCLASRQSLDITDAVAVGAYFEEKKPAVVINCSAYTAVDRAESDAENAFLVNEQGPKNLASCCKNHGTRLIHISTDFVFSGSADRPVKPDEETAPLGVYGVSKQAGEQAIQAELESGFLIIRTSWLYSPFNANFVKTMLRLMLDKDSLGVVSDQIGSPTSTISLCAALFKALENEPLSGIYHWSDAAEISWYDFAVAIQDSAVAAEILDNKIPINPISTSDYPTPAERPSYSVMDCTSAVKDFGLEQFDWKVKLNEVIQEIKKLNEQEKLGA
ncbi:MAG: dTDP-4-dehydrorhamnose reductase [Pseudohongiellaceae bacterium]